MFLQSDRVVSLIALEGRRALKKAQYAMVPGLILLIPGTIASGNVTRGLLGYGLTFVVIGALLVPMMTAADKKAGHLDFLARLPFSRLELALARLALCAVFATIGISGAYLIIRLAMHFADRIVPAAALIAVTSSAGLGFFVLAGFLTPLFARISVGVAVAAPAAVLWVVSQWASRTGFFESARNGLMVLLQRELTSKQVVLFLILGWIALGLLATLYLKAAGPTLQGRTAPTPRATAFRRTRAIGPKSHSAGTPIQAKL